MAKDWFDEHVMVIHVGAADMPAPKSPKMHTAVALNLYGSCPRTVTFTDADVTEECCAGLLARVARVDGSRFVECPHGSWVQLVGTGKPTTVHHKKALLCATCQTQREEAREQEKRVAAMLKAMPRARRKVAA